jgi:hypothetical protein
VEFALYYTVTAIIAYFLADWILDRIEIAYGKRFKYRNIIFFFLIFGLAYVVLFIISHGPWSAAPGQQEPQGMTPKLDK